MYEPPSSLAPEEKPEPKRETFVPTDPDLGDSIDVSVADPNAFEIDSATGLPKFYHGFDSAIAHLPKPQEPASNRLTLISQRFATVGALGGTVALLGLGGYAINRALQRRKLPKIDEAADESSVATERAEEPSQRYAFDWGNQR